MRGSWATFLPSVRPGERRALAYFFALLFVIGAGLSVGQGVANTLFLKRFGIQYLPWIYLAQGVGLAVVSVFYMTFADRLRPERLLNLILGGMVLLLALFWLLAQGPWAGLIHPYLYLLQVIASEILALHFTLYVGSYFDAEQSKRLLPMALAGTQLGEVCGGLLLAVGAPLAGTINMMLVWFVAGVAGWVMVHRWHARHGAIQHNKNMRRGGNPLQQAIQQIRQGLKFARESALLRNSLLAIFFTVIGVYLLSYLIKDAFAREFPREEDLATVFGMVSFIGGIASFLVQTLLTGRLLGRFGVRTMNLVFPISTLIALITFLLPSALLAAFVGATNRRVFLPAIRNPARGLMWLALPDYMQGRARGLSLAAVAPLAMVLAGLLVMGLGSLPGGIPGVGVAIALLAWHFSRNSNRAYMDAIMHTLRERLFVPRSDLAIMSVVSDSRFLESLVQGLASDDEILAEGFARLLMEHFGAQAVPAVLDRMKYASQPCRDRLSHLLAPHITHQHAAAWLAQLNECDGHGRATVLGVAFFSRQAGAKGHVAPCLNAENPRLAACGIIGGLCYDDSELRAAAMQRLGHMLNSGNVPELLAAMEMMTVLPRIEFRPLLCQTLEHDHPRLLLYALRALDVMGQPIVESKVVGLFARIYAGASDWQLRAACIRACRLLQPQERIDNWIAALNDPQLQVQRIAIESLAPQAPATVVPVLLDAMKAWRLGARGQAGALSVLADMVPFERMREIALGYLHEACRHRHCLHSLEVVTPAGELLGVVLAERERQLGDLGLQALTLGPDRTTAEIVRAAIASNDRRQRMRCLDLLEDYGDHDARELMRRLLLTAGGGQEKLSRSELAAMLTTGRDAWLGQVAQQWSTS